MFKIKSIPMKPLFTLLFLCFFLNSACGQGWERYYPEISSLDFRYGVVPTPDGGALLTADNEYGLEPHLLVKIGPGGANQWQQPQSNFFTAFRPNFLTVGNDHLLFAAFNAVGTVLTETDGNLQTIWTKTVPGVYLSLPAPLLEATPDGYLIAYQNGYDEAPVKVSKTDLQGTILWQKTYDFNALGTTIRYFTALASDSQGNFYLSGVQDFPYVPVLGKFSPQGNLIYLKSYPQPELIYGFNSLVVLKDSLIAAVSNSRTAIINADNGLVVKSFASASPSVVRRAADEKLLVYSNDSGNLSLRKLEWDGTLIWERIFDRPENFELISGHLWSLPDGGVMGMARFFNGVNYSPFVFRTDANGVTYTNRLNGNIFTDLNSDCLPESAAPNRVVIAAKPGDTRYATTNLQGNYDFSLDTGSYLLSVVPPNNAWTVCADSFLITINDGDTLQWNTGITTAISCPLPSIDLSAAFLRRCFPSTYTVNYANDGNVTADSAVVTLVLDDFLSLESSSLPYTSLGNNTYSFFVGEIAPLESGAFTVTVLVSCDAVLGQTHCSSVSIDVANPCISIGEEFARVEVNATCEGDSIAFTIRNAGEAPMPSLAEFIIIEDLKIIRQGQFQLPPQQESVIKIPADGSTSRMYAGQAPGASPFFAATTAVEGCNGPVQPGFWNMFPEGYKTGSVDRDCQPNIGAYDPNDKQATPSGYDAAHYIGVGVGLDYKIRFQNTGTDTAFTVVVRDTLSTWLDAASARPGPASHPYTWQLLGQGVLEFTFKNILLPDSNVNLAGSQGFVSFNIAQKPDLSLQTRIENRAAIYFDFNAPVLTNTTFHQVGEKFIKVGAWEPDQANVQIKAVPNPFVSETQIAVQGLSSPTALVLQIFDVSGNLIREISEKSGVFRIKRGNLGTGIYLFQIKQNGLLIGHGKLVVAE